MTQNAPWTVRHLYPTVDPGFDRYLRRMRPLISQARDAGWIYELHEVPLSDDSQILPALARIEPGELVIIDSHGWVDVDDPARLGTRAIGPYVQLANLPANSCSAGALVLGNCRGGRSEFLAAVARWVRRPTAVAYCFDEADYSDHSPIAIVREILGTAAGADENEALRAMDVAIYNHRATAWGCEKIEPAHEGSLQEA
ncbi:MAG TPA: hypothetical protein VL551_34180 [Actinospica sp.]|nr:hypothetical protein [Actinospica sp.]